MATKTNETVKVDDGMETVFLFYDGDKYKDPLFVGYNGKNYLVERGKEVRVPHGVAEIIRNADKQNAYAHHLMVQMANPSEND